MCWSPQERLFFSQKISTEWKNPSLAALINLEKGRLQRFSDHSWSDRHFNCAPTTEIDCEEKSLEPSEFFIDISCNLTDNGKKPEKK
jgi:hypothetical protein